MKSLLTLVSVVALTTPAAAETTPQPVSENAAVGLSVGATVASWAAVAGGLALDNNALAGGGLVGATVAPSLGHWYAHKPVTRGLVLRLGGAATVMVGGAIVVLASIGGMLGDDTRDLGTAGVTVLVAGGGLFAAGTVDDLINVKASARSYNKRLGATATVVPTAVPHGGGLAIVGSF